MCGICGFVSRQKITLTDLKQMNNTMYHRGPNDSGEEIYSMQGGYSVGMAQRRLSILDLSALGHQPMHSKDGRVTVVYNGEIYNYQKLREELRDYEFVSNCDTEVIIAGYLKWGINCIEKFNGMFAIAIYDRQTEALYLVRDRIGKKPLYYWMQDENIVFASELKPIIACPGFEKVIREDIISRYLFQQYINAPESIFKNVFKMEPGSVLEFKKGKRSSYKYWDVAQIYLGQRKLKTPSYQEAREELKSLLKDAVKSRMIADVPLGTFLSGGYDSSLVTAMAQEGNGVPVNTFSIGFSEEKYNEAKYAKEVADYLGTNHTELYIDEKQMIDLVESIPQYFDEPFADSSQIPSMLVSKLAREQVTVALSGDGGDEFFCGYNVYRQIEKAQKLDALGAITNVFCHLPGIRQTGLLEKLPFKVRAIAKNRNKEYKVQMASDKYLSAAQSMARQGVPCQYSTESTYYERNWQERRMLLDMDTYLPGDILCKVDRASMKYSLETRCPILDTKVMEYSYRLPHEYKYKNGVKKRILKDIAYEYIPRELLERPKVGFGVPLDKWLRGALREQLTDASSREFLQRQGIFNVDVLQNFLQDYLKTGDGGAGTGANYSRLVWAYFMFQKWYEYFIC